MQLQTLLQMALALTSSVLACPLSSGRVHSRSVPSINETSTLAERWTGPWMDPSSDKSHLWPRNDKGWALITYCYENHAAYEELSVDIEQAWEMWMKTIGSPGSSSGHALTMMAHRTKTNRPYCYYEGDMWNEELNKGALVVSLAAPGDGTHSNLGYTPDKENDKAGRNYVQFDVKNIMDADFAHELGHTFGLLHEHQRPDRDDYITFHCDKLEGYDQALAKAQLDGHTYTDLCTKRNIAEKYGFKAWDYMIEDTSMGATHSKAYDLASIMHYDSQQGSRPECQKSKPKECPLALWVDKEKHKEQIIDEKSHYPDFKITDLDAEAIKILYPWNK